MSFYATKNTVTSTLEPCVPWEFQITENITREIREVKTARQDWYRTVSTKHCFYTGVEPVNANQRPNKKDNPPQAINAIVADYDVEISDERINEIVASMPIKPMWVETSLGGKRRLIWILEASIVTNGIFDYACAVLGGVKKWLHLDLAPGLDEPALLDPCRLYCNGGVWRKIGEPVPMVKSQAFVVEVAKKYNFKGCAKGDEAIPLDVVFKKLQELFPDFSWPSEFAVGSQGPSFWVPGSISPNSAIVKNGGMITFAQHADKVFYRWTDILGVEFTKQYFEDAIANATHEIYWDGHDYWGKEKDGTYASRSESVQAVLWKCENRLSSKSSPDGSSQIEDARAYVFRNQRVKCAAPVVMRRPGLLILNGRRMLNTYALKPIEPFCGLVEEKWGPHGEFPFYSMWMELFYDPIGQLPYSLAWHKYAYCRALDWEPQPSCHSFFVGGTGVGKSLNNRFWYGASFGAFADASDFLIHGDTFNSHLFGTPYWALDDDNPGNTSAKFHAALKKMTANDSFMHNEKFHTAGMTEWKGLIGITANLDEVSLRIVGSLDNGVLDKTNLFRCAQSYAEFKFPDRVELEKIRLRELPHFLKWQADRKIPDDIAKDSRYGMRSYQEKSLLSRVQQTNPANFFKEILLDVLGDYFTAHPQATEWRGASVDLTAMVRSHPAAINDKAFGGMEVNRSMERLAKEDVIKCRTVSGAAYTRQWIIPRDPLFSNTQESGTPPQAADSRFQNK